MASRPPRAGIDTGLETTQGMISPSDPPFCDPETGTLAPVNFRFLNSLFNRIGDIEKALAAAGIPIPVGATQIRGRRERGI